MRDRRTERQSVSLFFLQQKVPPLSILNESEPSACVRACERGGKIHHGNKESAVRREEKLAFLPGHTKLCVKKEESLSLIPDVLFFLYFPISPCNLSLENTREEKSHSPSR